MRGMHRVQVKEINKKISKGEMTEHKTAGAVFIWQRMCHILISNNLDLYPLPPSPGPLRSRPCEGPYPPAYYNEVWLEKVVAEQVRPSYSPRACPNPIDTWPPEMPN